MTIKEKRSDQDRVSVVIFLFNIFNIRAQTNERR